MWLGWWNKNNAVPSRKYNKKPKEIQIFCHQKTHKKIRKMLKIMGSPNSSP